MTQDELAQLLLRALLEAAEKSDALVSGQPTNVLLDGSFDLRIAALALLRSGYVKGRERGE